MPGRNICQRTVLPANKVQHMAVDARIAAVVSDSPDVRVVRVMSVFG